MLQRFLLVCLLTLTFAFNAKAQMRDTIDWPGFMERHDMVWHKLPTVHRDAAWFGNGQLGSYLFKDGEKNRIRLWVFSAGVEERRGFEYGMSQYSRARLQIGSFYLTTVGNITGGKWRTSLYDGSLTGVITTDKGTIDITHFVHSDDMVMATKITTSDGEQGASWHFEPDSAEPTRAANAIDEASLKAATDRYKSAVPLRIWQPNPAPYETHDGDIKMSVQPLLAGAENTVAWTEKSLNKNTRVHYATVMQDKSGNRSRQMAKKALSQGVKKDSASYQQWEKVHKNWWNAYYKRSFVTLPDARIENVYWTQVYKQASLTRADRAVIDTAGIWQTPSPWPNNTTNLNTQLSYWLANGSNHIDDIGISLANRLHENTASLVENVRPREWQNDSAFLSHNNGDDFLQPRDIDRRNEWELGNLTWTMHNIWLQYRHTMDDKLLREKIFPLLRRSINFYRHVMTTDDTGTIHLPVTHSPEYGSDKNANYDLSLLKWGAATLIKINALLDLNDPLVPEWQYIAKNLHAFPADESGFKIGEDEPFRNAHRHYSHLLMVYPLYTFNIEQEGARALIEKSIETYERVNLKAYHETKQWGVFAGYTHTGLSSLNAAIGNGDEALRHLKGFVDYPLVHPNSLYSESGPVIETPLSAAQNVLDMLIQSWGDKVRVFPAVPDAWADIAFANLRTEGAFLVSAKRSGGKTDFITVESLAGVPLSLKTDMQGPLYAHLASGEVVPIKMVSEGLYDIALKKGEIVTISHSKSLKIHTIEPIQHPDDAQHWYGLKE